MIRNPVTGKLQFHGSTFGAWVVIALSVLCLGRPVITGLGWALTIVPSSYFDIVMAGPFVTALLIGAAALPIGVWWLEYARDDRQRILEEIERDAVARQAATREELP